MFSDFTSKIKGLVATNQTGPSVALSPEDAECMAEWGVTIEQENTLLRQLRDELLLETDLPPEFRDLECLRRYLRARKHDILKAKQMVLKTLAWRKEVGADTIAEVLNFTEKAQFHAHYPEGFFGTDREGRPVYVQQPGNIDVDELWKFTTMDRAIKYHITQQEKYVNLIAPASSVAAGKQRFQSIVLIDMEGVGVSTLTGEVRSIMGKIMSIDQDFYPELMHKALIINAPTTFRVIWSMIKYLLDSRTQSKIEVLPVDYKPELLKHIAPENLMVKYGGTNATPLIEEFGPWKDPKILAELEKRKSVLGGEEIVENGGVEAAPVVEEQAAAAAEVVA